jgi:diacylglycerol kinase family enzyme
VLLFKDFSSMMELTKLIRELLSFPYDGRFVRYFTTTQLTVTTQADDSPWPLTLDGEARCYDHFCAQVVPLALRVLLPEGCPLLSSTNRP